jgi:adenylosuccinate synthase
MATRPQLRIVLLSGRIGSGKTQLARQLEDRHGATVIRTKDLIRKASPRAADQRVALQRAGEALDRSTGGRWVGNVLVERVMDLNASRGVPSGLFVLDAVRVAGQIDAVREAFGSSTVHHIHLTASEPTLLHRYQGRRAPSDEGVSWETAAGNATERRVERLRGLADTVVDTDHCSPEAVLVRATALLGLYCRSVVPLVDVLVGGQYGSEGKGNIVGQIAPEYDRFARTFAAPWPTGTCSMLWRTPRPIGVPLGQQQHDGRHRGRERRDSPARMQKPHAGKVRGTAEAL